MRPDILNPLFAEMTTIDGIGPKMAAALDKLKIARIKDLLYHFPSGWIHRKAVDTLDAADAGQNIVIRLVISEHKSSHRPRGPMRILGSDADGNIVTLTFFGRGGHWARKQLPVGEERIISGRLDIYEDELQIVHPDHMEKPDSKALPQMAEPVYPLSDGISSKRLAQLVDDMSGKIPALDEWVEPSLLSKHNWASWDASLRSVHNENGKSEESGETGTGGESDKLSDRLAYDELFSSQLAMQLVRQEMDLRKGVPVKGDGRLVSQLKLPFELTGAQKRTIDEISGDLIQSRPMLRLLQGDVGSGKTVVALMTLLQAVEAGMQGALLAPTEILARQHFESLRELLAGMPVNVAILTGRDKGKPRESTLMGLADGSIDILIGTHAIFQESVQYKRLSVVVIDEQHRFGVSQRLMLSQKAIGVPHLLAMTATPIPRSLALANYGDMDSSKLDELPPGRMPVETLVMSQGRLGELVDGVGRHLESGKQAFWVCPLVEESENSDLAAAQQRAEQLRRRFGNKVAVVHGRMKGPEKDAVMEGFASGKTQLLVATTVIEVGVNIPNASLMVVEAADRFGLAQLHQLRGRVGRGAEKSRCVLVRSADIGETAKARLALMRETNDGFKVAEEDLRLRGAGEMLGVRQSGDNPYRIANDEQISKMIEIAADDAKLLLQRDGGLTEKRGKAARIALYLFERDAGVAALRSG